MKPAPSTATPCVSPQTMWLGNSPHVWLTTSYCCSPVPSTGALLPALSVARRIVGPAAATNVAAPAVLRNVRREAEVDDLRAGELAMAGSLNVDGGRKAQRG